MVCPKTGQEKGQTRAICVTEEFSDKDWCESAEAEALWGIELAYLGKSNQIILDSL